MRENDLLRHIYAASRSLGDRVQVGPGDDMAVVRVGGESLLLTVDQVADGVHVDTRTMSPTAIGRKAIHRSLSDVAAMAGLPVAALATASLPRTFGSDAAKELFDAMRAAAESHDCPLVGGDITIWDKPLLLTVTILGRPGDIPPVLRSGAKVGDAILVSGTLGGSLESVPGHPLKDPYTHHLDFTPRIGLARKLAQRATIHAMIDLSDGLGMDLARLCEASGTAALIEEDRLPASAGALQAQKRQGGTLWERILGDGEDYELCFTVDPAAGAGLEGHVDGVPITRFGEIVEAAGRPRLTLRLREGQEIPVENLGWEHSTERKPG